MDAAAQQLAQLESSIAALEAQRAILGDAVVGAAVAALRAQLAALEPRRPAAHDDADGERRIVTVMFADVSGFTALAEGIDAEHLRATVNACFSRLTPVIQRYGGTIDKFVGDEIMALFGAPIAHEDDADRALLAALEMREAIAGFNAEAGTALGLHFGINTGAVVAGGVGDRERRDYSVMGDAVNVAARLEDLSRDGEVLVGPETFRLTARRFEFDDLREITLKGKTVPLGVRRLVGPKASPEGDDPGEWRSPLVGRAAEIGRLHDLVRRLESGAGGIVAIRGDAGVGKSRLAAEVRRSLGAGIGWAEGRAFSYAEGISYAMARTLLYSLLGVRAEDSLSRIDEALQSRIALTCPDLLVDTYPYLARLLDLPLHSAFVEVLQPLSPEVLQTRTLRAWAAYLRARATAEPLVLTCEDLHWADPSSLHLLQTLLPLAFEAPLLFLLAYRREDSSAAAFHDAALGTFGDRYDVLDLHPLTSEDSRTLVGHLLHSRARAHPALMAILERAEGNPFFLEELLRNLVDAGALVPDEDGTLSVRALEAVSVPTTVQGVIMARVDRLPPESKTTLQTASVIGREFHREVLARVRAQEVASSIATERAVEDLQRKEFIRARHASAEATAADYLFKHVVTQDVSYNSLLLSRRRRLHEATGDAIEALFPDRLDELAGELAHHYRNAQRRDKAVTYLVRAADRARRSFANAEAIALYRSAIDELGHEDSAASAPPGLPGDLHERLGDVLALMGRHDEARASYEAALEAGGDAVQAAGRRRKWSLTYVIQRRYEEALEGYALAERALETERAVSMPSAWWQAWVQIQLGRMWVYYWQNRSDDADLLAARIRPAVDAEGTASQRAEFFVQNALSHLRRDRYVASDAAVAYAAAAHDALRYVDNPADLPHLSFVVGFAHLWRNQLDDAERELIKSLRQAQRVGDSVVELRCQTYLGLIARKRGATDQARKIFEQVASMASAARMAEYVAFAKAGFGWLAWREGRTGEAERDARAALDAWHAMQVPYPFDWMAAWIVVAACVSRDDLEDAVRHAEMMLAGSQQLLPEPLARATAAAVDAWKQGDAAGAARHLEDAIRLAALTGHL
jgi:class 3 adenylate cyclase/tetratricopeptide (TPR) repeat protein